jgi:hypothetical protein
MGESKGGSSMRKDRHPRAPPRQPLLQELLLLMLCWQLQSDRSIQCRQRKPTTATPRSIPTDPTAAVVPPYPPHPTPPGAWLFNGVHYCVLVPTGAADAAWSWRQCQFNMHICCIHCCGLLCISAALPARVAQEWPVEPTSKTAAQQVTGSSEAATAEHSTAKQAIKSGDLQ